MPLYDSSPHGFSHTILIINFINYAEVALSKAIEIRRLSGLANVKLIGHCADFIRERRRCLYMW